MNTLYTLLSFVQLILLLATAAGGLMAFRSSRRSATIAVQKDTIDALKERVELLEKKQLDLERDNTHLSATIELIQSALRQKGFVVTIDGEMVTVIDPAGQSSSSMRRRPQP